jgi:hypothetical protein
LLVVFLVGGVGSIIHQHLNNMKCDLYIVYFDCVKEGAALFGIANIDQPFGFGYFQQSP